MRENWETMPEFRDVQNELAKVPADIMEQGKNVRELQKEKINNFLCCAHEEQDKMFSR
jgi:hypothetical protein